MNYNKAGDGVGLQSQAVQHIIGQQHARQILYAQLATGRVHHAQIFHGPAGVGKFTTATALATRLLCHQPVEDLHGQTHACGTCASCRLLAGLTELAQRDAQAPDDPAASLASPHPDLHLVTKELALYDDDAQVRSRKLTTIPVSVIRTHLLGPAHLAPQMGHGKVFIIDEAELLAPTGQNALLKTLEEPPATGGGGSGGTGGGTTIILVTSNEDRLLPTIRSRCQRVPFSPLTDDEVGRWLDQHAHGPTAEISQAAAPGNPSDETGMFATATPPTPDTPPPLDDKTRRWVIGFAQGSIGRAALALRYDLAEWGRAVLTPIQRMSQGGRPKAQLGAAIAEHVDGFAKQYVAAHKNASKEAANRRAAALMGSMIAHYARRRLVDLAQQSDPEHPAQSEQAFAPWIAVIESVDQAEHQLAANVNLSLVCAGLGASITAQLTGQRATTGPPIHSR